MIFYGRDVFLSCTRNLQWPSCARIVSQETGSSVSASGLYFDTETILHIIHCKLAYIIMQYTSIY